MGTENSILPPLENQKYTAAGPEQKYRVSEQRHFLWNADRKFDEDFCDIKEKKYRYSLLHSWFVRNFFSLITVWSGLSSNFR